MTLFDAATTLFKTVLKQGDPEICLRKHLVVHGNRLEIENSEFAVCLADYDRVIVTGAGKATARMAGVLEDILEGISLPLKGIISVKSGHGVPLKHIRIFEASHPIPDSTGMKASLEIVQLLKNAGKKDLVISLFSGGGSALLPLPVPGITLQEMQKTTDLLLCSGAEIDEINAIRKHLSQVKGGRLMQFAYPATVCNLLLSDVLENRTDVIASGPFTPDESTFLQALSVCRKYHILEKIPGSVKRHLSEGEKGHVEETPKKDNPCFHNLYTKIIGSNQHALIAAGQKARELGFHTLVLSSRVKGEARELGKILAGIAREIRESGNPVPSPACIIAGGETTVTVTGPGKGGRNQECALSAVKEIDGMDDTLIFCAGTDGTDGPTDTAGAYCTGKTFIEGMEKGLDSREYLLRNDSYSYFEKMGNLIKTGPTGTNILDIAIVFTG
ncbi:MAG: glycerate kinase [Spirochaetales bacterium]|nr:glycerate kinase [Spirochaetales bacterium]